MPERLEAQDYRQLARLGEVQETRSLLSDDGDEKRLRCCCAGVAIRPTDRSCRLSRRASEAFSPAMGTAVVQRAERDFLPDTRLRRGPSARVRRSLPDFTRSARRPRQTVPVGVLVLGFIEVVRQVEMAKACAFNILRLAVPVICDRPYSEALNENAIARCQLDPKLSRGPIPSRRLEKDERPLAPVRRRRVRVRPVEAAPALERSRHLGRPEKQLALLFVARSRYFLDPHDDVEGRMVASLAHEVANFSRSTQRFEIHETVAASCLSENLFEPLPHCSFSRSLLACEK